MARQHKRWIAAGLLVAVIGVGLLALRQHRAEQAIRQRGADGSALRGLGADAITPPTLPAVPETPEAIAEDVAASLAAWRQAVLAKDADAVVRLDRTFVNSPDRYRAALIESARSESDERVRAFSTRVLGKQKSPALADLFEALLADRSPFVRQNAAWALGELAVDADGRAAARRAVAELRHARAKDPAADVRTAAKGALARLE
jgi:HEAT repeat protein